MARTLLENVWEAHVVREEPGEPALLSVDLHLVHEVDVASGIPGVAARRAGERDR